MHIMSVRMTTKNVPLLAPFYALYLDETKERMDLFVFTGKMAKDDFQKAPFLHAYRLER